ncbi:hypothetical protein ASD12_29230 [Mesorhizobium sp. Root102]|nr:hypothetical protein ASD12_29230 [Mesorhizobium sp. Root102]
MRPVVRTTERWLLIWACVCSQVITRVSGRASATLVTQTATPARKAIDRLFTANTTELPIDEYGPVLENGKDISTDEIAGWERLAPNMRRISR